MRPKIVPRIPSEGLPRDDPGFSLVLGGPLYQLLLATRLVRPPLHLLARRVVGITLICWLPLLLLAEIGGRLYAGVSIPFLLDPEVHTRLLVGLPLLIVAEVLAHDRISKIIAQFLERGIVASQDQPRFQDLVDSSMRLRNSVMTELVLFVLVAAFGYEMWSHNLTITMSSFSVPSWYASTDGGRRLTAAGSYYALVSLSIFRFILIRWYIRLFIWYRFLWKLRAMPLHFNLYHPDRAGGLGFLSNSLMAFAPVFVAQSSILSGVIFTRIRYAGDKLPDFKMEIAGALLFFILVIVLPLGFFSVQLERAARTARREFGALASRYVDDFRQKWILGGPREGEPLLGTSDIQSLADLANSFNVISEIRILPLSKQAFLRLVVLIVLPLVPLALTVIPAREIAQRLFKLVF